MSDYENDYNDQAVDEEARPAEEYDDEDQDEDLPTDPRRGRRHDDEDDEEDEDEDDDDDEEEEEEDQGTSRGRKRAKHRHKPAASRFIDFEATVASDEEEEDDEEEYGRDEFIAEPGLDDEEDTSRTAARHARFDMGRDDFDDAQLAKLAEDIAQRHKQSGARYTGDMNEVPQRLLMPSVHDANLWQVRVKPGREREIVFSLMRKAIDLQYSANPIHILSAFQRDSLPGMIYVEARSSQQVGKAIAGLVGVYPSRGFTLVPIEEMASLLQIKKQDVTVALNTWVRIKRGKYQGDLAQVIDISSENGEDIGLKFIPRIDLNPKDETLAGGKRKKGTVIGTSTSMRPPQRFFNYEEVVKVYGRKQVSKRNQVYVFQNDTYKDGFIEKDFKLSALQLDDVNPSLDEITRFTRGVEGREDEKVDLSIIAEASRKAAVAVLQPGDHVEVFEGEQSGVEGTVHAVNQDVVTITAAGVDLEGQRIDVPARSVRKRFKPGDHVKVMAGQNEGETGLVVSIHDNVVTFLSDMSMQEVSVFSKDLRTAAEVGSGSNTVGNYELHDLVQLDSQTVGVIFKTERDSFRVLDQNGQIRLVQPHQISMRKDTERSIATDAEGHEIRKNDNMKEVEGEGRRGRVLHVYQSFYAFLHNREVAENGGVFVARARSLQSVAPKGNLIKPGTDLSKMNPALSGGASGGMVGSGNMGRGPRDRLIGVLVVVIKGPHKGYIGIIKDTNGPIARVELNTGNKIISIDKEKLRRRNPNTGQNEPLEGPFNNMGPPSRAPNGGMGHQNGSRTPGWAAVGRTPNPYAQNDGRTPAWNAASRTPNPYADTGKTPAWNASSRTPNPYADGGRTPAWNASASTPTHNNWGGATPARNSWGGATPRANNGWGGNTENSTSWGETWSAPTPAAAPTPATAPTPGAYGGFSAPTPGDTYGFSAPTPGDIYGHGISAPTPGAPLISAEDPAESDWLTQQSSNYNPAGTLTQLSGTRGDGDHPIWYNGEHEGKRGKIKSVLVAAHGLPSTAQVEFDDGQEVTVPVEYLQMIYPSRTDDRALVVRGDRLGEIFIVRSDHEDYDDTTNDSESSVLQVSPQGQTSTFYFPRHLLAKMAPE